MPIATPEQCRECMKDTIRIAISMICLKRNIFPPAAFGTSKLMDISMKSLNPADKNAGALVQALETGVFDAMDKGFIREIVFGIFLNRDMPMELVESYNFRISTSPSMPQSVQSLVESVSKFTNHLMSTLDGLPSLPENKDILIKCFYKSNTPADYSISCFSECKAFGNLHIASEKAPYEVSLERFETPYEAIGLKLYVPSYITIDPQIPSVAAQKEQQMLKEKVDEILGGKIGTREWTLAILHRILSLNFPILLKDAAQFARCSVYRIRKVAAECPFIRISKNVLSVLDQTKLEFALQCATHELEDML